MLAIPRETVLAGKEGHTCVQGLVEHRAQVQAPGEPGPEEKSSVGGDPLARRKMSTQGFVERVPATAVFLAHVAQPGASGGIEKVLEHQRLRQAVGMEVGGLLQPFQVGEEVFARG